MAEPVVVRAVVDGPAGAPALVLSHSLGAALEIWDPQLPALTERFRIVRYDLRGHGGSPAPAGPYGIADLGADLIALLDRLAIERAHLCGTSLGGMVSLWTAAHAPERVDRVVAICTSARLGPPERWAARAAAVRANGAATIARDVVSRWFTPGMAEREPDLVARMEAMFGATPAEGYASCCEVIERMDLEPDLDRIDAPTLVIMGAADQSIPPPHGARIVAGLRNGRLEIVDRAAHLANVERAAAVTALLLGHLAGPPEDGTTRRGTPAAETAGR